jgi:hypothetical protein
MIGVGSVTLSSWIYTGKCPMPTHKIGGRRIFFKGEVLEYLESLCCDKHNFSKGGIHEK